MLVLDAVPSVIGGCGIFYYSRKYCMPEQAVDLISVQIVVGLLINLQSFTSQPEIVEADCKHPGIPS